MNSSINEKINTAFRVAIKSIDSSEDLDFDARMVMYRFLSEVEKIAEEKKINRKELASRIGTSASYITQLFRGSKLINMVTIAKLEKALDVRFEVKAAFNRAEEGYDGATDCYFPNSEEVPQGFWVYHNFNMKDIYEQPSDDGIVAETKKRIRAI